MSWDSISESFREQFIDQFYVKTQKMTSDLSEYVEWQPVENAEEWVYNELDSVTSIERTGRAQDIVSGSTEHTVRKLTKKTWSISLDIDQKDVRSMIANPIPKYVELCVAEMNDRIDRTVIEAAEANVITSKDGGTIITAAQDGVETVDATAGFTYEKILEMNKNFTNKDVKRRWKDFAMVVTGDEEEKMLQESELTSGDFSRHYFVDQGSIASALGYKVLLQGADIQYPLLPVAAGVRSCYVFPKRAFYGKMPVSTKVDLKDISGMKYETYRLIVTLELGVVRKEGLLVQKITTTV